MEAWDPPKSIIFSKEAFYGFLKDVPNKTLTFEVSTPSKMEAESYRKTVKSDVRYKSTKFWKIFCFGLRFGSQDGVKLATKLVQNRLKNRSQNEKCARNASWGFQSLSRRSPGVIFGGFLDVFGVIFFMFFHQESISS